ncbi:hypothetical protein [Lysobacter sp. 5GHs7-4]|nr:hypothetical protein [Lysobacter sp. 5GHs7-4]
MKAMQQVPCGAIAQGAAPCAQSRCADAVDRLRGDDARDVGDRR